MTIEDKKELVKKTAIGLAILLVFYWITHQSKGSDKLVLPPPTVIVQKPQFMDITDYVVQTGNTVAFNSVNLVARIPGYLEEQNFTDGTFVKKGQNLFVIEPQPYYEQLEAAKATVAAQKAAYAYAVAEHARQLNMYKQNAASLNNVEVWAAKRDEGKAEVDKAEASAINAEINYSYTHVLAPFDGRIGRHLVDLGNYVGNGTATKLATIEQIQPIYVYINLNELDLIKIRNAARKKGFNPADINKIQVDVALQSDTGFPHKGTLNFVNTGLNASTGTMELRAILPNKNLDLLPGLFVQVRIPVDGPNKKLTVPDSSILYDQIGAYLLLVDKNNIVQLRRVVVGGLEQGMRAINKGINPDDQVIVSGLQNATPNHKVIIKTEKTTNAEKSR